MSDSSILVLAGIGVPPYSARGLKQTLTPIGSALNLKRTINGELLDLSDEVLRKYASTITGTDQDPPALDLVWPGRMLTVSCIVELSQEGTLTGMDALIEDDLGRPPVTWPAREADGFLFYRPQLSMRVVGWDINRDEWGAVADWTLNLEEV